MIDNIYIEQLFVIFLAVSIMGVIVLYARQAILIAYILVGFLLGPSGLDYVKDPSWVEDLSSIGIVYLLFLLGLNLQPKKAFTMLGEAVSVTTASSIFFFLIIACVTKLGGYSLLDSLVVGTAMAFSSTIIGLKLLPTTTLHHKRRGEMIISVLLLQDFMAIILLLIYANYSGEAAGEINKILSTLVLLPIVIAVAFYIEKFVIDYLIGRFDEIHEFLFLLAMGWCSCFALLFEYLGFSYEVGGFVAGVMLASCPASQFFTEKLKPIRDFFLVLFFFSLGASFNLNMLHETIFMATILSFVVVLGKPYVFAKLFKIQGENKRQAKEVGVRLGQAGEFGILLAIASFEGGLLSEKGNDLIQLTVILTFIFSSYYITSSYPTPISLKDSLRRD